MRKYVACLAAVAAATLIGPALAAAHGNAAGAHSKQGIIVVGRNHSRVGYYVDRSHPKAAARVASCPAGGPFGFGYCTPPSEQNLFGAYAWNDGGVTFGSSSSNTCKALGWTTTPCGVYTTQANTLIVVFAGVDGRYGYGQSLTVSCSAPNGATCPTFKKVNSENGAQGDSEIWYADATSVISQTKPIYVTATAVNSNCGTHWTSPCDVSLQAVTFTGAITTGATGTQATGIGASSVCYSGNAAPSCTLKTTESDSLVWAAINNPAAAKIPTWPSNQFAVGVADPGNNKTFYSQFLGTCTSKNCSSMTLVGNGIVFYQNPYTLAPTPTPTPGPVTINDTAPTNNPFNEVVVEIL